MRIDPELDSICGNCCFSLRQHKGPKSFCPKKVNGRWDSKTYLETKTFSSLRSVPDGCANGELQIGNRWR